MKTTKTPFRKPFLILLLIFCIQTITSCKKEESAAQSRNISSALSGESIFRGIFFLEGSLPSRVSYLNKKLDAANDINVQEDISKVKTQIIDEIILGIKNMSPTYFHDLENSYYQKDNYALNENIKKGADLLYIGLLKSDKMNKIAPDLNKILKKIDIDSYDFQNKQEISDFLNDVNKATLDSNTTSAIAVAAVVAVVAAVTVVVAVSWVGAVQVAGYFLAWTKTKVRAVEDETIFDDFDSQLLTRDLIDAID